MTPAVATIRNDDPQITRPVYLYVRRADPDDEGARYGIFSDTGQDYGDYRWHTRDEAYAAINKLWGHGWNLQWLTDERNIK